jgi:hypothetical protein
VRKQTAPIIGDVLLERENIEHPVEEEKLG